jgi:excisionase family DNA binding protein
MPTNLNGGTWASVPELAVELGVVPSLLYRLARQGRLPGAHRLGRTIRIDREAFLAGSDVRAC